MKIFDIDFQVAWGLAIITFGLIVYIYRMNRKEYPDGPTVFPILGNLPQIIAAGDMVKFLEKYRKIYGNVYTVEMGGSSRVVISGSSNMQYLLVQNADSTSNRPVHSMPPRFAEFNKTNQGFVWAPYPDWKIVRSFAVNVLKEEGMGKSTMEPRIIAEIDRYVDHFISPCLETPIDMTLSLTYATSNIISQMVVGQTFNYEDPALKTLNAAYVGLIKSHMKAAITKNIPFATYLPGDLSAQCQEKETTEIITLMLTNMVAEGRKNLLSGNQNNFISQALLKAQSQQEKGMTESLFRDANIVGTTGQLYVAGTETSTTALRWALLYMILYPDIQERVRKEIHEAIGERQVSMKNRLSLPYTDAVLHEVLRCGNILPTSVPHMADKQIVVEGKTIPAGAELLFNMHSVLHDPELLLEPDMFKPERFLGPEGQALKSKISPFGIGRRACLGESLARMEFFLFFVSFLQKFKVKYPPNRKPSLEAHVSLVRSPQAYEIVFQRC